MSFVTRRPETLAAAADDYPLAAEADRWSQRKMALKTTEVPTFFGPAHSPLFGVLHLPADNQIRGGVLICGSLGKEGMDSVRLQRILADDVARRGFAALRFDYLGLGDSAYDQGRDDAVANWVASVGHALDYLTLIGAESATAIGIRAGCLILDKYLAQSHTVKRVVYLDPYGTGRRYLREHTTLFRVSVGGDATMTGEVSIVGGRLSDHAAAEFTALRMGVNPLGDHGVDNLLLVGRPADNDKRVTALGVGRRSRFNHYRRSAGMRPADGVFATDPFHRGRFDHRLDRRKSYHSHPSRRTSLLDNGDDAGRGARPGRRSREHRTNRARTAFSLSARCPDAGVPRPQRRCCSS